MYSKATSTRLLYTLFIAQSLFSAAQIAIATLMTIVAVRLGGAESVAGLPSSTLTFTQALCAVPVALIMGRFGRRLGLILGYAAGTLGGVVGVLAVVNGLFPLLLLSAALIGLGRASSEQSRYVAGEIFPEAERARMIGRLVFAGTIGAIVGPVLVSPSGRLMQSFNLHPDAGPWVAMIVLCGIATIIVSLFLRPDPTTQARALAAQNQETRKNSANPPVRPLSKLLMLPKVQLAILAVLISQTVMVVLMTMTPLHMDHMAMGNMAGMGDMSGMPDNRDEISLVIAMHTLGMFGLSPLTGYLIDRFGRLRMLFLGTLILAAAALLAPIAVGVAPLAFSLFLLGLGWNFGYVSGASLLADALRDQELARVQGVNDALVFFVAGLGTLSAGPLFASGGYQAVSSLGLALVLFLMAMIWWLRRPQPTAEMA
ncbi:MAG: MFS transporter [Chloroflexota bacterium]